MNETVKHPLDEAVEAARVLPARTQEMLAAEIMQRVEELGCSHLTPAHREEVRQRLTGPTRYADPALVRQFFERHGVAE
jgi:hypothetical protein